MDSSNSSSSSSSSSNNNKSSWRPKAAAEIVDLTNDISDKEDETSNIKRPMIDISFIRQLLPTTEDNADNDDALVAAYIFAGRSRKLSKESTFKAVKFEDDDGHLIPIESGTISLLEEHITVVDKSRTFLLNEWKEEEASFILEKQQWKKKQYIFRMKKRINTDLKAYILQDRTHLVTLKTALSKHALKLQKINPSSPAKRKPCAHVKKTSINILPSTSNLSESNDTLARFFTPRKKSKSVQRPDSPVSESDLYKREQSKQPAKKKAQQLEQQEDDEQICPQHHQQQQQQQQQAVQGENDAYNQLQEVDDLQHEEEGDDLPEDEDDDDYEQQEEEDDNSVDHDDEDDDYEYDEEEEEDINIASIVDAQTMLLLAYESD